jgi:iron complex transport system ATP-binding protein
MRLLRQAANDGKAVVLVVHDINLAQHYCDHIILMQGGRIGAQGTSSEVFTPAQLEPIFKVAFSEIKAHGAAYIVPRRE